MKLVRCLAAIVTVTLSISGAAFAATDKPNILFIMGDDIGIYNVAAGE